jgi:serine/threonine-protein kinase
MTDETQPDAWDRVDEVFRRALELSGDERARFLADLRATNAHMARRVETLLRADKEAEDAGFLERPAEVTWWPLVDDLAAEKRSVRSGTSRDRTGERLGPYEVVSEIGTGGMATVYRARRADGRFEQQVAVKVIQPGLATEAQLRRFADERQILAGLDHPGIARLLDAGTTADGLPYLVMEFVDGVPITEWCDRRALTVKERLRLFMEVAEAVQHAHGNLVLHRDLKPSNILVTDVGQVKLLDFGIAKLLDPATGIGQPTLTRRGFRPLTPEYASPEQVRGEALTTASDVYQLGVLLYRLLAGGFPYRVHGTTRRDIEAAITETDPEAPSERIARLDADAPAAAATGDGVRERGEPAETAAVVSEETVPSTTRSIANRRGTRPDRLRSQLRGDLDTIVLKALRKEPERRYPSVERLAADIRAHLRGHPIAARSDRWSYRAKKFLSRHPWLAPAAAAVLLATGGYMWTLDRHAAALEREAARATQMRDFLVTVFEGSDPEETLGDTVTARTLLERGAARADSVLTDQPELRAEMLGVIGRIMTNLGFHDRAVTLLGRVAELKREVHGPDDLRVARALLDLGDAYVHPWSELSDNAAARRHYQEALEIYRAAPARSDSVLLPALRRLAITVPGYGPSHPATDSAQRHLEEALEIAASVHGRDSEPYALLLIERAQRFLAQRRLDEAESHFREAMARLRAIGRPRHPEVARILYGLAAVENGRGNISESARHIRASLDLYTELYGRGHPRTAQAAIAMNNVLLAQGEVDRVLELLRETVEAVSDRWPEGHWRVGVAHTNLGVGHLRHASDTAAAVTHLRRAERILTGELGERHFRTFRARVWLSALLLGRRSSDADTWTQRTRAQLSSLTPGERSETLGWVPIGEVVEQLEALGRTEEARRWRALGLEARAWSAVGGLERGYPPEPLIERLERARSAFAELSPAEQPEMARPIGWLAARLDSAGRPDLAARWRSLLPE